MDTVTRKKNTGEPGNPGQFGHRPHTESDISLPPDATGHRNSMTTTVTGNPKLPLKQLETLAVFDTETTGISPHDDRIVTAYLGIMDRGGTLLEERHWLINPGTAIPDSAAAIHGISTEKAKQDGADPHDAIRDIRTSIADHIHSGAALVAYNSVFDLTILTKESERHGHETITQIGPVIDPFVIDKGIDKYRRGSRKLIDTAAHYGISLDNAHSADADAIAAGRLAWELLNKISPDGERTTGWVHKLQRAWWTQQRDSLKDYFQRIGKTDATFAATWPIDH